MCNVAALSVSLGGHAAGPCRQGESEASKKGVAFAGGCQAAVSSACYESNDDEYKTKDQFSS